MLQAWLSFLTDLSGRPVLEEQWHTDLCPTTQALLHELGRHYAPFLVANAEALARGEERLECTLPDGTPWSQPSYPCKLSAPFQLHFHTAGALRSIEHASLGCLPLLCFATMCSAYCLRLWSCVGAFLRAMMDNQTRPSVSAGCAKITTASARLPGPP